MAATPAARNSTDLLSRDTDVEIDGTAVTSLVDSAADLAPYYRELAIEVLGRHGLPEPQAGQWYDAAGFLGALEYVRETAGERTVSHIGMEMVELIAWEQADSVTDALDALEDRYGRLHRGNGGTYDVELTGDRSARITARTPYPPAFDRGLLKGIGYAFSEGVPLVTERGTDDGSQTYELTW